MAINLHFPKRIGRFLGTIDNLNGIRMARRGRARRGMARRDVR